MGRGSSFVKGGVGLLGALKENLSSTRESKDGKLEERKGGKGVQGRGRSAKKDVKETKVTRGRGRGGWRRGL